MSCEIMTTQTTTNKGLLRDIEIQTVNSEYFFVKVEFTSNFFLVKYKAKILPTMKGKVFKCG